MSSSKTSQIYLRERTRKRNAKDSSAEDLFATDLNQSAADFFSENRNDYMDELARHSDRTKPPTEVSNSPSCIRMYEAHEKIKEQWNISSLLPRDHSLLDGLIIDQKNTISWQQPLLNKVLDATTMDHYTTQIVSHDKKKFFNAIKDFNLGHKMTKTLYFDSNLFPFMVQTIKIPAKAYKELKSGGPNRADEIVTVKCPINMDNPVEVPVALSFSDGYSNMVTIKFPWLKKPVIHKDSNKIKSHTFTFSFCPLPRDINLFLSAVDRVMYSDNAKHQLEVLSTFVKDIYDVDVKIGVVDIGAIALTAGCRMDSYDLFSLSAVTLGEVFPHDLDNMDQRWGWENPPKICIEYLGSKFRYLNEIYQILMGTLMRNMFPDPDIVLFAMRMTQSTFIPWFSQFVAEALIDTRIYSEPGHEHEHIDISTRAGMLQSIKFGHNILLDQLSELYYNVPVPMCGGARFIHHTRNAFFGQFAVLERVHLKFYSGEQPRPRNDLLDKKLELMFHREYVIDDSGEPACGFDLMSSPQFSKSIYCLNLGSLNNEFFILKTQGDRPLSAAICEWIRLNVSQIQRFFGILNRLTVDELKEFWVERIRIYDYARGLSTRVLVDNLRVRALDLILSNREDNVRVRLESSLSSGSVTDASRVNLFNDKTYSEADERTGLQQAVYVQVPGSNKKENMRKEKLRQKRRNKFAKNVQGALSAREYRRAKKFRVLDNVKNIINPVQSSVSNGDNQKVRFEFSSDDHSRGFSRDESGGSRDSGSRGQSSNNREVRSSRSYDKSGGSSYESRRHDDNGHRSSSSKHSDNGSRNSSRYSGNDSRYSGNDSRYSGNDSRYSASGSGYQSSYKSGESSRSRRYSRSRSPPRLSSQDLRNNLQRRH